MSTPPMTRSSRPLWMPSEHEPSWVAAAALAGGASAGLGMHPAALQQQQEWGQGASSGRVAPLQGPRPCWVRPRGGCMVGPLPCPVPHRRRSWLGAGSIWWCVGSTPLTGGLVGGGAVQPSSAAGVGINHLHLCMSHVNQRSAWLWCRPLTPHKHKRITCLCCWPTHALLCLPHGGLAFRAIPAALPVGVLLHRIVDTILAPPPYVLMCGGAGAASWSC